MVQPEDDEVELTLIGPGYGEAIAVHLGSGDWMVVDSCEDPETHSLPVLAYFDSINVDPSKQVRLVVATHWHDDHMRGLGSLVGAAEQAFLVHSPAVDDRACRALIALEDPSAVKGLGRGFRELRQAVDVLLQRKRSDRSLKVREIAHAGTLLYQRGPTTVRALSPSSEAVITTIEYLGRLLRAGNDRNLVARPNANHAAIVLWVEAFGHRMLLGADLQKHANPQQGWLHMINEPLVRPVYQADLLKVPHHGGRSAHQSEMWTELLVEHPVSLVCPWTLGRRSLPSTKDVERLCELSKEVWISGPRELTPSTSTEPGPEEEWVLGPPGRVTARRRLNESAWRIEAANPAERLCQRAPESSTVPGG
jgi:hypothetical protein